MRKMTQAEVEKMAAEAGAYSVPYSEVDYSMYMSPVMRIEEPRPEIRYYPPGLGRVDGKEERE